MSEEKNKTGTRSVWIAGGLCALLAVLAFCWTNPELWFSREKQPSEPSVPEDFRDILEKHLRGAEEKTQLLAQRLKPSLAKPLTMFRNMPKPSWVGAASGNWCWTIFQVTTKTVMKSI